VHLVALLGALGLLPGPGSYVSELGFTIKRAA
jgi:hypothetical protein